MPDHNREKKARTAIGVLYAGFAAGATQARPLMEPEQGSAPERPRLTRPGRSRRVALGELFRSIPWTRD